MNPSSSNPPWLVKEGIKSECLIAKAGKQLTEASVIAPKASNE
jgi:hypothetical protein